MDNQKFLEEVEETKGMLDHLFCSIDEPKLLPHLEKSIAEFEKFQDKINEIILA